MEIGLIMVNYNSVAAVAQFLDDIDDQNSGGFRMTVIVADNSARSGDLSELQSAYEGSDSVHFLPIPENPGYLGAAHLAFRHFWPEQLPEWLIVANSDIRLPQAEFFTRLAGLDGKKRAVVAPRILSGQTGVDQNPFHRRRPSAWRMYLIRYILRFRLLHFLLGVQSRMRKRLRGRRETGTASSIASQIYAPHGAFMIFHRSYFKHGGDLNVGSFLYAEEIYVAESCRRLGLQVSYEPQLEVLHDEHASVGVSPMVRSFQIESADYCYREFFSCAARVRERL